jgi:glycosyltransferase involved in cell wall biosynthesis
LLVEVKKILFVVNAPEYFLSHRFCIAKVAIDKGFEVHVAGPPSGKVHAGEEDPINTIKKHKVIYHEVEIVRGGQNPLRELISLLQLIRLFLAIKPDLVHLITIKPVLYGGIAARMAGVGAVVSAVSGLGTVFLADSTNAKLRRWIVTRLYTAAFKQKRLAVIFQNPDDRDTLISLGTLQPSQARMIRGSGVSLPDYPFVPEPDGVPKVVLAARLLRDKGVLEYVEAARLLHQRGVEVQMWLIGSTDPGNPTTVTQHEIDQWEQEGSIRPIGFRNDIAEQYAAANIVCLPSYREGLPKSLVEAAACGRAVVTTDVPGCRDAITPDVTGLLVPVKDAQALADAIQKLIENPEMRKQMGQAGRALAEEAFAIEKIVEQHMHIYTELLGNE